MPPQQSSSSDHSADYNGEDPRSMGFTSGFLRYPKFRDYPLYQKHSDMYLDGKAETDRVGEYWRIHDGIYDLSSFASNHPGGKSWIQRTRGHDITELFESSHINSSLVNKVLDKYLIKRTDEPRNSPFTFNDNGFYRTLKRRVAPVLTQHGGTGPDWRIKFIMDGLVVATLGCGLAATLLASKSLAIVAGLLLGLVFNCVHNFIHQRDQWRQYYSAIFMTTTKDYRIVHAIGHHPFPNTIFDMEVYVLEPFLEYFPVRSKSFVQRYLPPIYIHLKLIMVQCFFITIRIFFALKGDLGLESFIVFFPLLGYAMISQDIWNSLLVWFIMHIVSYYFVMMHSVGATHHHPENYHDGDAPRGDKDWGLFQLDATNERKEYYNNLFLTSVMFGDHSLHHLFPTVDVSKLNHLYPVFFQTCREFNVNFKLYRQLEVTFLSYKQIHKITPREEPPERKGFSLPNCIEPHHRICVEE